jgi:sortase A
MKITPEQSAGSRLARWNSRLGKLQIALLIFGVLALGYGAWVLVDAHLYQKRAVRQFESRARSEAGTSQPAERRPALQPVADGTPFARLEIDRLNMDTMVIEGVTDADLRKAVGHIPYTALPGNPGNVGLAGHRDTSFRQLRHIQDGDLISLTTSQGRHVYQVENTEIVKPEDSEVLRPTAQPTLTLVTCFPFYYVGSAPNRFIVQAVELQPRTDLPSNAGNLSLTR